MYTCQHPWLYGSVRVLTQVIGLNTPPGGNRSFTSWYPWQARASCLRLLAHFMRLAASRTFWTAGSSRPIRMAMMAITTKSSIRVKPDRRFIRTFLPSRRNTEMMAKHVGPNVESRLTAPRSGAPEKVDESLFEGGVR